MEADTQAMPAPAGVNEESSAAHSSASETVHPAAAPPSGQLGPATEINEPAVQPGRSEAEGAGLLEPAHENGVGRGLHARKESVASMHSDSGKVDGQSGKKESVSLEILKGAVNFAYAFGTLDLTQVQKEIKRMKRKTWPRLQTLIKESPEELQHFVKDFTLRNFWRVHMCYFIISTLTYGLAIHIMQPELPFLDTWFSATAAMTGGSLMPYDIDRLKRQSEVVLWFAMTFGGITLLSSVTCLWRIYLFRGKLKPTLYNIEELRSRLTKDGADLSTAEVSEWLPEESYYETLLDEFTQQDKGLRVMAAIIITYTMLWHVVGSACLYAAMMEYGPVAEYAERGITDAWFSIFMISSCLNNVGLSLLNDSLMPVADRRMPLLIMGWAIVLGNTAYPIVLRFALVVLRRISPNNKGVKYCLDNPQRSHFMLYSNVQTWALVFAVASTNLFQLFFFMASSTELVRDGRTDTHMWLLGWFQSVNSRSAGLQVFDLKRIAKVMLVIYGFFMWLNPFPIVMAMEREQLMFEGHPIISQFMKKYVTKHNSWIFIFFLVIASAEQDQLKESGNWPITSDKPATTLYHILFELLSAYGTNGLSMGFPGVSYSLCGTFKPESKLCLILLMLIGRHRSMPGRADPALVVAVRESTETLDKLREIAILRSIPSEDLVNSPFAFLVEGLSVEALRGTMSSLATGAMDLTMNVASGAMDLTKNVATGAMSLAKQASGAVTGHAQHNELSDSPGGSQRNRPAAVELAEEGAGRGGHGGAAAAGVDGEGVGAERVSRGEVGKSS